MIIREKEPVNLEMPFGSLDGFITPTESFFVRCHFPIPPIDAANWRLSIEGEVEKAVELTYADLRAMSARTITATLECAGNSRAFLVPQAKGAQWERGAVGNAEWTGVPLADVLQRAGLKPSALDVILEGADEGEIKEPPRPAGKIHFARSLPVRKASEDVLLAYAMNGEDLTPAHGFPVRAVVPGWYGVASVKWLTRILVSARTFHGYFQSFDYTRWDRTAGEPTLVPITEMEVKAEIAQPEIGERVPAGASYRVHGAAWTGGAKIAKVEISLDAGANWHEARLCGQPVTNAWQLWDYEWQVPKQPGKTTLLVRATDTLGHTQPAEHDADCGSYMINHPLPIEVEVS